MKGRIVAAHGRHYVVDCADRSLTCFPRAKRSEYACGDLVGVEAAGTGQGRIVELFERHTLLYRSDAFRQKLIAANATLVIAVVATDPPFSDDLLARTLMAAEAGGLDTLIVLNKVDLADRLDAARAHLQEYQALGYRVTELCARRDVAPLRAAIVGQVAVLVGQSGMGKSTLVNALVPGARAATAEISRALASGRHTTTHTTLYRLDESSALIDSPGLQSFGLAHLQRSELEAAFREFRPHAGACRFRDCSHRSEPDCAIRVALAAGRITPRRLELFLRLCDELEYADSQRQTGAAPRRPSPA
ncbi:MAG: ribosome small subunit-dependent GTPase A [Rhodocyclaceae bacterium]|nr:ribosome small subunit-dependent GTPase A [Rhodocyclaceae bacterium]